MYFYHYWVLWESISLFLMHILIFFMNLICGSNSIPYFWRPSIFPSDMRMHILGINCLHRFQLCKKIMMHENSLLSNSLRLLEKRIIFYIFMVLQISCRRQEIPRELPKTLKTMMWSRFLVYFGWDSLDLSFNYKFSLSNDFWSVQNMLL